MTMIMLAFWIVVWVFVIVFGLLAALALLEWMGRGKPAGPYYEGEQLVRWQAAARREDRLCWAFGGGWILIAGLLLFLLGKA